MIRIVNDRTGDLLADRARRADTVWTRLRGLIGRPPLQRGEGLVISPCNGVHTWFMRAAIDVLLLDREHRVLHACPRLAPYRRSPIVWKAHAVVELAPGAAAATRVGDRLRLEGCE